MPHHVRAEHYSIPEHLHAHVEAVFNTVQVEPLTNKHYVLDPVHSPNPELVERALAIAEEREIHSGREKTATTFSGLTTIAYLNAYYNIVNNMGNKSLSQSVFQTNDEHFSQRDLKQFQTTNGITVQAAQNIGGNITNCTAGDCFEGNLDLQVIIGPFRSTSFFTF